MQVVVTGGTGYLGEAVTASLVERGHQVKVIARHSTRVPGAIAHLGDLRDMDLIEPLTGADAVVNLVGIIREVPQNRVTFEMMHVEVLRRIVRSMAVVGVSHLIHVSALGTRPKAESRYHQTKWVAEQMIHATPGLDATILRPSLVFGGDAPFFLLLSKLANLPIAPIPGAGETVFQPIYRGDVARMVGASLTDTRALGRTFEMGGPERYSLNRLYDILAQKRGHRPRPKWHVPLALMNLMALSSRLVPGMPITEDQLAMLTERNATDDNRWQDLAGEATPFV